MLFRYWKRFDWTGVTDYKYSADNEIDDELCFIMVIECTFEFRLTTDIYVSQLMILFIASLTAVTRGCSIRTKLFIRQSRSVVEIESYTTYTVIGIYHNNMTWQASRFRVYSGNIQWHCNGTSSVP